MNKIIAVVIGASICLVLVIGSTMWLRRAIYNVVTTVTVEEVYPGILCAKMVTRDGAAIDCWRDEPGTAEAVRAPE